MSEFMIIEDADATYMIETFGYNSILTKQEALPVIQKLIDFYINTDDDEILWSNEYKKERANSYYDTNKPKDRNVNGFVYIFKCDDTYKIGFSRDVKRRFKEVAAMQPKPMSIILEKYFDNAFRVERYYHTKFKEFNVQGEWFRFSENQIHQIIQDINSLDKEYLKYETANR